MLRIERNSDGCVTTLRLSGRIQRYSVASIRAAMKDGCRHKTLDLTDVTLVDMATVRFLMSCENEGVDVVQCPTWVREWMIRELAADARAA